MNLTWGEYWLLETAVHAWIPCRFLVHPQITQLFNKSGHNLTDHQLLDVLARLLDRGEIVCRNKARGEHRPTLEEMARALVYQQDHRPKDGLVYGLSEAGGLRWEAATQPTWSDYVQDVFWTDKADVPAGGSNRVGEIVSMDRSRAEKCVEGTDRPILASTLRWDRLEPWKVTYWKTLPVGHRACFRYGPERQVTCGEELRRSWHDDNSQWFIQPKFAKGGL